MFPQRVAGVVPTGQSKEQAPPMTVTNFTRMELGLVEYGDENGRKVTTVAFIVGDKVFLPPNGEQWTNGFRSFVKQLSDQIILRHTDMKMKESGATSGQVPAKDAVDVTGGGQ